MAIVGRKQLPDPVVLIAATPEPEEQLGLDLPTEAESESSADIFTGMEIRRERHPLEPLFSGSWE